LRPASEDTPYALSPKNGTDTNTVNPAVSCGREFLPRIRPALCAYVAREREPEAQFPKRSTLAHEANAQDYEPERHTLSLDDSIALTVR